MDEVIDDIISMQSNYDIQGFIDAVQMPNTVSESNTLMSCELVSSDRYFCHMSEFTQSIFFFLCRPEYLI